MGIIVIRFVQFVSVKLGFDFRFYLFLNLQVLVCLCGRLLRVSFEFYFGLWLRLYFIFLGGVNFIRLFRLYVIFEYLFYVGFLVIFLLDIVFRFENFRYFFMSFGIIILNQLCLCFRGWGYSREVLLIFFFICIREIRFLVCLLNLLIILFWVEFDTVLFRLFTERFRVRLSCGIFLGLVGKKQRGFLEINLDFIEIFGNVCCKVDLVIVVLGVWIMGFVGFLVWKGWFCFEFRLLSFELVNCL